MLVWGRNVAWYYYGRDSFFHGNIKIGHGVFWFVLGSIVELLYTRAIYPVTQELQDYGFLDAL
jgi:hypothetical protein